MKRIITHSIKLLTAVALLAFAGGASAHDDHELIELVMKKGHKGKTSRPVRTPPPSSRNFTTCM
ncbi:MAG: hypothetical protein ACKVHO_10230 [Verrucomicrobiia bacterium]